MGTLLAVDGNSLGHRAFHARAQDAPTGPHVTSTFVRMLATAWAHGPYDAVFVAFDGEGNRRKEIDAAYKAHRPPAPDDLHAQLERLRELLATCGLAVGREHGVEADDLLAAAVDACGRRGWRCDLLSSDRDLTALVAGHVRLLRPRATMSDLVVDDLEGVQRAYGIAPSQYTDLAALRGDPSDGLDGVRGIGPKLAARLLRDHGDVPGIYAVLHELPPKIEASLRAGREQVERNLLLMAPLPRVSLDEDAVFAATVHPPRVAEVLGPLGLEAAARHLARAVAAPPRPPVPPAPEEPDEPPAPRRRHLVAAPQDGEQAALF